MSDSCDPMDHSMPGSSVCGISQVRYGSGLPFPSPEDLPNSGIEPMSPALADGVFTTELLEKPQHIQTIEYYPVFEKKEVHSAIFNNVDEPRGHYGK